MTDIRDYEGTGQAMDLSDTIVHQCPCGSELFRTVVGFEDYEMSVYCLDGECLECGTRVKLPTPLDRPENDD